MKKHTSSLVTNFSRFIKIFLASLLCVSVFSLQASATQTDAEIKAENERLAEEARQSKAKEQELQGNVANQRRDVSTLNSELAELDRQVSIVSGRVSAEEAKLRAAEIEVAKLNEQSQQKELEIEALEERISNQAIAGFQLGEVRANDEMDPTKQLRMQKLLEDLTESQIDNVRELEGLVLELEQERAIAADLKSEIQKSKDLLDIEKAKFDAAKQQQQAVVLEAELALEARLAEAAVVAEYNQDIAAQIRQNDAELVRRASNRTSSSGGTRLAFTAPSAGEIVKVQGIWVHQSIEDDVNRMFNAAAAAGHKLGGWGYRDNASQIRLRKQHCGTSEYAIYSMPSSSCRPPTARPGASQHERGLAIDLTCNGGSMRNPCLSWLRSNASSYGLYNLPSEPWHWSTTGR